MLYGLFALPQGQPQALSNFVRDEGGASTAAAAGTAAAAAAAGGGGSEGGGGEGTGGEGAPRWLWRGPGPPSLWYALEMSGREVGASMEVRLSVNSSAPAAAAAAFSGPGRGGSPTAWHMGPGLTAASGAADDERGPGGGEAQGLASAYPSANIEDASSMNLSVAMRVGALPVIDPNGETKVVRWWSVVSSFLRIARRRWTNIQPRGKCWTKRQTRTDPDLAWALLSR